jgi:hypothetical protein
MKQVLRLRTTPEKSAYILAHSFLPYKHNRPLLPYLVIKRFMGYAGDSYQDPRRVRAKFSALLRRINKVRGIGGTFKIDEFNSEGIYLEEVKAIKSAKQEQSYDPKAKVNPALDEEVVPSVSDQHNYVFEPENL